MILTPKIILLPILAAVITFLAMPLVRRFSLKFGSVANPGGRHIHKNVIPLSGGIAIFIGFFSRCLVLE